MGNDGRTKPTESVWDYPRPPALEPSSEHLVLRFGGRVVAETTRSFRVLETSHPPTYYLPHDCFAEGVLRPVERRTWCEWKGEAAYFDLVSGEVVDPAGAWTYPAPRGRFGPLLDHVAVYPGHLDSATVDGEQVRSQEGDFYGGWITDRVTGPFKGAPGTRGW